ncbi:MAG: thrombospondin type 3 repeat-containing protein, partial [Myxococcaceae bacterium]|nr:thrombospondin type 3 repeat-containing protein [Myxococcaceae bacterium]
MRSSRLEVLAGLAVLGISLSAHAQGTPELRSFDSVPNKVTPLQNAGISLEGADTPAASSFRAALLMDLPVGVLGLKLGQERLGDLIPYRLDAHALFAYQLLPRLELGVDLPLTLLQGDNFGLLSAQGFPSTGVASLGLGDIRVLPRVTILHPREAPVGVGVVLEGRLPTGDKQSFLGERSFVFAPRVALEVPVGPVRVLGSVGARLRQPAQFLQLYVDNEATFGAGVVAALPDVASLTEVKAVGEMHLSTPLSAPFTFRDADSLKTPWEVLAGVRARVSDRWGAELNVGRGVTVEPGYGREAFRVMAALRYDFEGNDRDGDGIADAEDACPSVPEDRDGFQDADGCPDSDNDADGLPDGQDTCPNEAGPAEYEGCPDRDEDQIPDNIDRCPDLPGPAENDGCEFADEPQVVVESDRLRVRGNVLFETGKAKIQRQSFKMLDEVAAVLSKNMELGPVIIEGHTDDVGNR